MDEIECVKRATELDKQGNISLAVKLCEAYPCSENAHCQRYLGWIYMGRGELEKAASWYMRAAAQGDPQAIEDCWKFATAIDAKGDKERAVSLCKTAPLSEHLGC